MSTTPLIAKEVGQAPPALEGISLVAPSKTHPPADHATRGKVSLVAAATLPSRAREPLPFWLSCLCCCLYCEPIDNPSFENFEAL